MGLSQTPGLFQEGVRGGPCWWVTWQIPPSVLPVAGLSPESMCYRRAGGERPSPPRREAHPAGSRAVTPRHGTSSNRPQSAAGYMQTHLRCRVQSRHEAAESHPSTQPPWFCLQGGPAASARVRRVHVRPLGGNRITDRKAPPGASTFQRPRRGRELASSSSHALNTENLQPRRSLTA